MVGSDLHHSLIQIELRLHDRKQWSTQISLISNINKKKIKTEIISATGFNHKEEGFLNTLESRYEVIEKLES